MKDIIKTFLIGLAFIIYCVFILTFTIGPGYMYSDTHNVYYLLFYIPQGIFVIYAIGLMVTS